MQRRIRKRNRENMGSTQKKGWGWRWVTSARNRMEKNNGGKTEKESDTSKQSISRKTPAQGRTGDVHPGRALQKERQNRQPQQQPSNREDKKKKKKSTRWHALLFVSSSVFSVHRSVENLPRGESAFHLLPQQLPLLLGTFHEASVLLGSPRQVGHHLIHRPIGDVLKDGEACLTWGWSGWDGRKQKKKLLCSVIWMTMIYADKLQYFYVYVQISSKAHNFSCYNFRITTGRHVDWPPSGCCIWMRRAAVFCLSGSHTVTGFTGLIFQICWNKFPFN